MLRNLFLQTVFFFIIFMALSWFRESDMLAKNTNINQLLEPNLMLASVTGQKVELVGSDKETLVYFFAPWCQVCNFSIENLQDFAKKMPDYHVIAVALDFNQEADVLEFVSRHELDLPVVFGTEAVKKAFKVKGYPSYYVLNKKSEVIGKSLGFSSEIGMIVRTL